MERGWLRQEFKRTQTDSVKVSKLLSEIASKCSPEGASTPAIIKAYYGALKTLEAKFSPNLFRKSRSVREGLSWLDQARRDAPEDLEVHFVRFATHHQIPRFFASRERLREDMEFLCQNLSRKDYSIVDAVTQQDMIRFLLASGRASRQQTEGLRSLLTEAGER